MRKRLIIGIVGPPGAGKTTAAKYLNDIGFETVRLSSFLEKEAEKKFGKIDRQSLQDVGNEFRKKYGPSILAKLAFEKIGDEGKIVIDGIRNLAEIKFFKKQDNFSLIGIVADPEIRFKRLGKIKEKIYPSWQEFLRLDARDKGRGQSKAGLQVSKCLAQADYLIENNGKQNELQEKISDFLKKIKI